MFYIIFVLKRVALFKKYFLSFTLFFSVIVFGLIAASEPIANVSASLSSGKWNGQRIHTGTDSFSFYSLDLSDQKNKFKYRLQIAKSAESEILYLDGSFMSYSPNNWAFGYGLKERHWSPSSMNSLILSRNAKPFQSFYVQTESDQKFNSKYLNWMGKWSAEFFIGSLEKNRNIERAKIVGARFKFKPLDGLEIDLVRTAQFGGKGKSESLKTFFGLILGQNDIGDEANQLAGLGVSYEVLRGKVPIKIYGQMIGEDEAGYLPSCFMYLAGFEISSTISSIPSKFSIDGLDTVISKTKNGWCGPNTAYNNGNYASGYTHQGKTMGASIDTASRSLNISAEHKFSKHDLLWSISKININVPSLGDHRLSSKSVSGYDFSVGTKFDLASSELTSRIYYQGFALDTAKQKMGLKLSVSLSKQF